MTLDDLRREYFENRLGRAVGGGFAAERAAIMDLLGYPPDLGNIPPEFWANGASATAATLQPIVEDIAVESGIALQQEVVGSVVLSWEMVNTDAATWAKRYVFDLVNGINDTSLDWLRKVIPQFFEEAWTREQLEVQLRKIYSAVRAEMIAVTEVTRANVEGEKLVVRRILEDTGLGMRPIWQTNNDDLVCALCGPRHNKEITDGIYPPIHPRCRCWVNHEILESSL